MLCEVEEGGGGGVEEGDGLDPGQDDVLAYFDAEPAEA